jgi:ketosteroid isomerase-like protein
VSEIRETIEANNRKFSEFIRKGDAEALASLYTRDAICYRRVAQWSREARPCVSSGREP